jgi:hypothetical protein
MLFKSIHSYSGIIATHIILNDRVNMIDLIGFNSKLSHCMYGMVASYNPILCMTHDNGDVNTINQTK